MALLPQTPGDDDVRGTQGNDTFGPSQGEDAVLGRAGNDVLRGGSGDDKLIGGRGADRLFGGADDDLLSGSRGNDTLEGGVGDNNLIGGPGSDTFRIDLGTGIGAPGDTNVIADFVDGVDRILLRDNGDPLTSDQIQTMRDAAQRGDPNALDDPDHAVQAFTEPASTPQGSVVNIDFGQIPSPIPGFDVLTVVGTHSLGLQVVGDDLFLV